MSRVLCALIVLLLCSTGLAETFLITSDLHLTRDITAHQPTLDALRAASKDVDAVILLGDSTNNGHDEEHAAVLGFMASLAKPCYIIPGNHDITLDISDFIGIYGDYGWKQAFSRDEASGSCAVLTEHGICLLLLDTNDMPGYVAPLGGIEKATRDWVVRTVSSLPPETIIVACGHHPILPSERWTKTPGAGELVEALSGVKLYLCGHDHGFAAVQVNGLQQITVGQPHVYPGWAEVVEVNPDGFHCTVLPLYDEPTRQSMRADAREMAEAMARGILTGTAYEDDAAAIQWFEEAFEMWLTSQLTIEDCTRLLNAPSAEKWRKIETRTVVRDWLFNLLENCPQDVKEIDLGF